MSNPLEAFTASLPKAPPLSPPSIPPEPKAKPAQQSVPVAPSNPKSSEMTAAYIQWLLSDECSDSDRSLAFRTLAKATGNDLIVTPWTVFSHLMTALALAGLFLLSVKAVAFGKSPSGIAYLQFTPGFCGAVSVVSGVLAIVFRRRPEILLPILAGTIGVLGAVSLAVHL
jgi:hypothetical protein